MFCETQSSAIIRFVSVSVVRNLGLLRYFERSFSAPLGGGCWPQRNLHTGMWTLIALLDIGDIVLARWVVRGETRAYAWLSYSVCCLYSFARGILVVAVLFVMNAAIALYSSC